MPKEAIAEPSAAKEDKIDEIGGQQCPMCGNNTLTLMESEKEVPFFGKVFLFSMNCSECKYHKADIEGAEQHEPCRYTLDIGSEEDMKIRVIKSSEGTVKIPRIGSIEPGPAANGYITNVEGVLNRIKHQIESIKDNSDEKEDVKKAKNLLKKLTKIMWGQEKSKLILEDPSGNSAIISDKAVRKKM